MQLTILGSGSMTPTKTRNPSSCLLQIGKDFLLLDCGHGTLKRLVDINFPFEKIDYIFISHFHTDHFSDLMPFIHSLLHQLIIGSKKKRKKPLTIIGPRDLNRAYQTIRDVMWPHKNEWRYVPIVFKKAKNSRFRFKNFSLKTLSIFHAETLDNLSYKITANNKTLVYSGDLNSAMDKTAFIRFIKDADVLIIDSARPIGWRGGHLEPVEVGQIASQAQVKYLIPTHLTDIDSPSAILKEVKKNYQGKVSIAKDLMKINI